MYGPEAFAVLILLGIAAVVFIAPIIALVKAFSVGQQVESLRREIEQLRRSLQDARRTGPVESPPESPAAAAAPPGVPYVPAPPPAVEPQVQQAEPVQPAPAQPVAPQRPYVDWRMPPVSAAPAVTRQPAPGGRSVGEWEMLIGGNIVNRIAAIGMIIVAAFFLKYAYDHSWITPWMIVTIGFAVGLALLYAGARFHRADAQIFAQGLLGAGISILYLSGYAMFRYDLASQPIALGIMSVVTAIAFLQALSYDSLVVCVLGLAGGFLTPLLLGDNAGNGSINHFGLFAYIALLDAGLLAVSLKKDSWAAIDPLALAGTCITYVVWFDRYFTPSLVTTAIPFVTVVWALFCCADFCRIARSISTYKDLRAFVGVCISGLFYLAMFVLIDHRFTDEAQFKHWMALVSLMIGAVYFISLLALLRSRTEDRSFIPRYVLTAIALLAASTGIAYTGFLQASLWAVEALGLVWCGLRWKTRSAVGAGVVLFVVAATGLLAQDSALACQDTGAFIPVWNPRFAGFATLALAFGLAAFLFCRSEDEERETLRTLFQIACCSVVLVLLAVETNDFFRRLTGLHPLGRLHDLYDYTRYVAIGGVWALYSVVLLGLGFLRRSNLLSYFGIGALALGTVVVAGNGFNTGPTALFLPVVNTRAPGFALILATLVVGRYLLAGRRSDWAGVLSEVFRITISLLVFELVTVETCMLFAWPPVLRRIPEPSPNVEFLKYLALGAAWVIYSLPVVWQGLKERSQTVAVIGLCALGAGVAVIAAQGYSFEPIERFVLFVNVRVAAFAIAAVGILIHCRMLTHMASGFQWVKGFRVVLQVVVSLLIFELVTAETVGFFDKMATRPGELLLRFSENMRQMTLSVAWLIYSFVLISIGFWRRARTLRFVAIGLFGVAILKVFISDLSFLEPLYRIFSFAGLAVILFATSYLYQRQKGLILGGEPAAPLPDKEANHDN